ncbi:ATP-binding protein [Rhizobium sp. BK377]|uniref:ATP-binding protein n=1 Tax=Rhizobium sp. BK377 TaxID=2587058 RepID=UPI001609FB91|nr:winged helix-turn-helix domain-containing protein [Rhizobium sp. BK377]MBB3461309.1 putative ATPase/DNA-binding winged helix-turn-helix (wHTH) protein [Rhizobium sp. BK377]
MTSDLAEQLSRSFSFGPFVLIPERQLLLQGDAPVRIGGRALDILTTLVERPGELVNKRELIARVWPNIVVDDGNLKVNMAALRRALGDGIGTAQYIATVTGRGYRFIAPVQVDESPVLAPSSTAAAMRSHNLPIATTRVFGRTDAIEAIRRDLDASRLVSIVGAGGVGKTTVALAAAEQALGSFRDGVWLIDLALLKDSSLVPNAVAAAIGLATHSANLLAALGSYLRDCEMLLVFDNCEHIIEAAAFCADRILAEAPCVRILATSREPLGVRGERVRRLPGLGAPPPSSDLNAAEALRYPAIQLFVDRATDRLESFELSDANALTVAEICRRLDGLALAIELAATRVDSFGLDGLFAHLDDRFRLLSGHRAGPERHRTLTAVIEWSYDLLSQSECTVIRRLSVFSGSFSLDAACAVADEGLERVRIIDDVASLVAKSLLSMDVAADKLAYRLLETTRAYCLERLQLSGEEEPVRRRHAEHICAVLERAASEWASRPAPDWAHAYGGVLDDLRSALDWAGGIAADGSLYARLSVAGCLLWNHFSLTEECRVHVSRALEELDAAGLAGTAAEMQLQVSLAGVTMFMRGAISPAMDAMQRALEIAVRIGDIDHQLRCLRLIGTYQLFGGEHDAGIATLETFVSVAAGADPSALPAGETHLAVADLFIARFDGARQRIERFYGNYLKDSNDPRFARFLYDRNVDVGNILSHIQWLTGLPDTAARTAEVTIALARKTGHELSLSNALAWASLTFLLSRRYQECGRFAAMLDDQIVRHGIVIWRPVAIFCRGAAACAQDDTAAEGLGLLEQAVEEFRAIRHLARFPFYLGGFAEALAKYGRLADAAATIREALDCAYTQNEQWCVPELLRIRASILKAEVRPYEAETLLIESMAVAREIGALSWRLRSACDLAMLWRVRSREHDARKMLQPVYNEFTEGFETPDLAVAAGLLASFAQLGDGEAV